MKKIFLAGLAIVFGLGLGVAESRAAEKIVFVNIQKAFEGYYKTKLANSQIQAQMTAAKQDGQELVDKYKVLKEEFEKLRAESKDDAYTKEVQREKRHSAEAKLVEMQRQKVRIQKYEKTQARQFNEQKGRMKTRILSEIRGVILKEANREGYGAVLNVSSKSNQGLESVIYHDENLEITAAILAILNKGHNPDQDEQKDI